MDRLIKKPNYFHYTTGEIRKSIDPGESDDKERTPSASREFKCLLVKDFILYYNSKDIKVFDSSARGKDEYCGPCQLSRITSLALIISLIDTYLSGTAESTWKSYKYIYKIFNGRKI
jgi:hypothetical protein